MKTNKPESFVLDDSIRGCGFLEEERVTCKFFGSGHVQIEKIETFNQRFQTWKDITVEALAHPEEIEKLRDELADWYIDERYERLCFPKQKQFNNDEPPAA